jgi:hypothetical protein
MITNLVNDKCYIGQTKQEKVSRRWRNHRSGPHGLLKLAFEKYGIDNFKFETLMQVDVAELDEKEIDEINMRNTDSTKWIQFGKRRA